MLLENPFKLLSFHRFSANQLSPWSTELPDRAVNSETTGRFGIITPAAFFTISLGVFLAYKKNLPIRMISTSQSLRLFSNPYDGIRDCVYCSLNLGLSGYSPGRKTQRSSCP